MTTHEQKAIIYKASNATAAHLCSLIDRGKVPANWGESELRWLLSVWHDPKSSKAISVSTKPSKKRRTHRAA